MALLADFVVQTAAGVLGAFAGVFLALLADRHKQRRESTAQTRDQMEEYARGRQAVIGSVVKNTAEAKQITHQLASGNPAPILQAGLEVAVWEATREQFIRLCASAEERALFAQFFDGVRRLQRFVEFRRGLQASALAAGAQLGPEFGPFLGAADRELGALADDVRLSGMFLVTDFGLPVHKRMLGIVADPPPPDAAATRPTE